MATRGRSSEGGGLAAVMGRIGAGEGAAVFELIDTWRDELARTVRSIAGQRRARLGAGEVDDLVVDAALAIADIAGSWSPDGAPPWVYARGRIAAAVDRHIGQWSEPLDDESFSQREQPASAPAAEVGTAEVFARLATEHRMVALLRDGLGRVASERDLVVFVELGVQVALGDPSPAVTVARMYGMQPAAVRQQNRRMRVRLRQLADREPRFAPLAELPMVA